MPDFTAEDLKSKSLDELAVLGERYQPLSAEGILVKNELQSRIISSAPKTIRWYAKPFGQLLLGVVASLLACILWYLFGWH
jgi:hypothetical protein